MSAYVGQQSAQGGAYPFSGGFQMNTQFAGLQGDGQGQQQQVYVDPETIKQQRASSLAYVENQTTALKDRAKGEYDSQLQSVVMKAEHEISLASTAMEQSKQQALFALDQQHMQRQLEIEQRAQEQRMQIDSTASQLTLQAQQQRIHREMQEKLAKLQHSYPGGGNIDFFGTAKHVQAQSQSQSQGSYYGPNMFNVPDLFGTQAILFPKSEQK